MLSDGDALMTYDSNQDRITGEKYSSILLDEKQTRQGGLGYESGKY